MPNSIGTRQNLPKRSPAGSWCSRGTCSTCPAAATPSDETAASQHRPVSPPPTWPSLEWLRPFSERLNQPKPQLRKAHRAPRIFSASPKNLRSSRRADLRVRGSAQSKKPTFFLPPAFFFFPRNGDGVGSPVTHSYGIPELLDPEAPARRFLSKNKKIRTLKHHRACHAKTLWRDLRCSYQPGGGEELQARAALFWQRSADTCGEANVIACLSRTTQTEFGESNPPRSQDRRRTKNSYSLPPFLIRHSAADITFLPFLLELVWACPMIVAA